MTEENLTQMSTAPRLVGSDLDDDFDHENDYTKLTPNDIKRVDNVTGEFTYANDAGVLVTLKRQRAQSYNWLAF
jgi:hypothetical protein